MKPKLVLADDHELFLEGLRSLLQHEFDIGGVATDGRQLVELARRLRPHAVVADMTMPQLNGIDAARQIRTIDPSIKFVLLTMHVDPLYAKEALEAGISAYVLKHATGSELIRAIREVLSGRAYISPLIDRHTLDSLRRAGHRSGTSLSPRQREVLQLIAEGRSSKEIADCMKISPRTVEFHKNMIMAKLGAHNSTDLIRYAVKHGLVA